MNKMQLLLLLLSLLILANTFLSKSTVSQKTSEKHVDNSVRKIQPCSVNNSSICYDDIPVHVPNPCEQCKKPDGNCGAALRCVCHPKECRVQVISAGAVVKPWSNLVFYHLFSLILRHFHTF